MALRRAPETGELEVLAVHRPRYDDLTLPKGKLEPGETAPVCAVREVYEETGVHIRLSVPLDATYHSVGRQSKQTFWWLADTLSVEPHAPDDEVDQVRWLGIEQARRMLTYDDDVALVEQAMEQPRTTTLIVTRHAKAMLRKNWMGRDAARPLNRRGRTQSRELTGILDAYGVAEVFSSSSNRCVSTVLPFVTSHHTSIDRRSILSEEVGVPDPDGVIRLMRELRRRVIATRTPLVVCGHRPVLPMMLAGLDLPERPFATAESVIVTLTDDNLVHTAEWVQTSA